jgi:hypothetical protein
MNWLLPDDDLETYKANTSLANQPSLMTLNYWVARCVPLWLPGLCRPGNEGHRTHFIACNRTGTERGALGAAPLTQT